MPIFTLLATAVLGGTFLAGAIPFVAGALGIATSIGLSYAAQALAGKKDTATPTSTATPFSVSGKLQAAGDLARSFIFGTGMTAGSLVYANTWGNDDKTPNAFLVQVIALSDLPVDSLAQVYVNGDAVTLGAFNTTLGYAVTDYNKDTVDYLYVKFYDGTQTAADAYLVDKFVTDSNRPYAATRVGKGVAYAIVTARVNDQLFSGFPTFKFVLNGVKLYDPTKDDTNGGSGSHRWSDPTTWGGDGDKFPAVQLYTLLRGMTFGGNWFYGLQNTANTRLPSTNWNAQIEKCRDQITGVSGLEATYRTGGEVTISAPIADAIQALLTGCQGRLIETGGFYKARVGAPDSPVWSFTDDAVISTAEQSFTPFFGLADTINGIAATYPSPAQAYASTTAPPLYRPDLETQDGSRRLMANVAYNLVPYDAQVQRLMKSALDEARRARRHTLVLPPEAWLLEPGDVISWTSDRNGYDSKSFRIDGMIDADYLDITIDITEVDPTDYDWDHGTDFQTPVDGPIVRLVPVPQPIIDWSAEPAVVIDANGVERRPAINLSWDGAQDDVIGVAFEIRNGFGSNDVVHRGRTDNVAAASIIVTQSLLPNTAYQARGRYLPYSTRETLWSDWLDVTTPDTRLSLYDVDAAIKAQVTLVMDYLNDKIDNLTQQIAALAMNQDTRNWLDKKSIRRDLDSVSGTLSASFEEVITVATDTQAAFAAFQTTVTASVGALSASVSTNATAIANINGTLAASYTLTLDVNGYVTGYQFINGGVGVSAFTVTADKFQIAAPGTAGGLAVPIFTVANVNGVAKVALRGDMYADGSINATKIIAGSIDAVQIAEGGVSIDNLIAGAATHISFGAIGGAIHVASNSQQILLSVGFASVGGICHVDAVVSGQDDTTNQLNGAGHSFVVSANLYTAYSLWIDGIQYDALICANQVSSIYDGGIFSFFLSQRSNATLRTAANIPAGNHIAQIRVQLSPNVVLTASATFDRGSIEIFESRR